MNSINIINPIVVPDDSLQISIVGVTRGEDGRIALQFGSPVEGDAFNIFVTQEVLDKLAIAVVRFIQAETAKANQEKKA